MADDYGAQVWQLEVGVLFKEYMLIIHTRYRRAFSPARLYRDRALHSPSRHSTFK